MPITSSRCFGPAAALVLLYLPLMPAYAATFLVDDDQLQCPSATYSAINDAVAAAAPGDTVRVCAGLYEETITVNKPGLRLEGPRKGSAGRTRTLGSPGEAVIRHRRPLVLGAVGVVLDGFTVQVQLDDEGEGQGIHLGAPGCRIRNNVFDDDLVSGIIVISTGGPTTWIERNHFIGRFGIAADTESGGAANMMIRDNLFTNAGIIFVGANLGEHRDIQILRNRFRHDPQAPAACLGSGYSHVLCRPLIVLHYVDAARIEQNQMVAGHAVRLKSVRGASILDNALRAGIDDGIVLLDGNEDVLVAGNRINGYSGAGILLDAAAETVVEGNEVEDNGYGIRLINGAGQNQVRINNVEDNGAVGIQVLSSAGNQFTGNESRGNGTWDCQDNTVGAESFGTANTWIGNEGSRSTPTGLCPDQP